MFRNAVKIAGVLLVLVALLAGSQAFAAQTVRTGPAVRPALEETVTPEPTTDSEEAHTVVAAIAAYFNVPEADVLALHEAGAGFGVIVQAYVLSELLGKTPQQVIDMKATGDLNWGHMLKEQGVQQDKSRVKLGTIMSDAGKTPEPEATPHGVKNGQGADHQGNGQGNEQNGQGNGNGGDKGNGGKGNNGGGKGNGDSHGGGKSGKGK
jgi:penicillin-binding protein 2A